MKRIYVKPQMERVRFKSRPQLLQGTSPTTTVNSVKTNFEGSDDDFIYANGSDRQGR